MDNNDIELKAEWLKNEFDNVIFIFRESNNTEAIENIYNTYFKILNDIQKGIQYYNTLNSYTKNSIIKKINQIFNDTSFALNNDLKNIVKIEISNNPFLE